MSGATTAPLVLLALLATIGTARPARAETRLYTIAIGNNDAPASAGEELGSLHYADDDAAAFFDFARAMSVRAQILTALDADSQRRFPQLVSVARPPTLKELRRTVEEFRGAMATDSRAGDKPVLLLFYSGHGVQEADGRPAALTLLDEGLTRQRLYDDVLAVLSDSTIHIFIDACYAEDVVRPRDLQLDVVQPSQHDIEHLVERNTLARFPRVGAIVAAATSGQTHEWDLYHQGIFTHELLSGLRGAADVNDDGAIEYSEMTAFLSAANREVADLRARLRVVSHAPPSDRRLPIIELRRLPAALRLQVLGGKPPYFFVEDRHGNRLVELRSEEGYRFQVVLPSGEPLYFVSPTKTVEFQGKPGESLNADQLAARPADVRPRGAISAALRRGLFAASFGPSYYRGFVDSGGDIVSVDLHPPSLTLREPVAQAPSDHPRHLLGGWSLAAFSTAIALGAAAATFEVLAVRAASEYEAARYERAATSARHRAERNRALAIATGTAGAVAAGIGGWTVWRRRAARTASAEVDIVLAAPGAGARLRW